LLNSFDDLFESTYSRTRHSKVVYIQYYIYSIYNSPKVRVTLSHCHAFQLAFSFDIPLIESSCSVQWRRLNFRVCVFITDVVFG
ncbi:hypothetical protein, partial [Bacteroides sp. AF16-49]|uniref:hypothetical protein n=1 Tax=Bacteroides sp. AF16-49 TaxID=2292192 RepID=UPI001F37D3F7